MSKRLNPIVSKSPRITHAAQIENHARKLKFPGPGTHAVKFVTPRALGGKADQGRMSGCLDNTEFLGL